MSLYKCQGDSLKHEKSNFFFCVKCSLILCTNCLIDHLCKNQHHESTKIPFLDKYLEDITSECNVMQSVLDKEFNKYSSNFMCKHKEKASDIKTKVDDMLMNWTTEITKIKNEFTVLFDTLLSTKKPVEKENYNNYNVEFMNISKAIAAVREGSMKRTITPDVLTKKLFEWRKFNDDLISKYNNNGENEMKRNNSKKSQSVSDQIWDMIMCQESKNIWYYLNVIFNKVRKLNLSSQKLEDDGSWVSCNSNNSNNSNNIKTNLMINSNQTKLAVPSQSAVLSESLPIRQPLSHIVEDISMKSINNNSNNNNINNSEIIKSKKQTEIPIDTIQPVRLTEKTPTQAQWLPRRDLDFLSNYPYTSPNLLSLKLKVKNSPNQILVYSSNTQSITSYNIENSIWKNFWTQTYPFKGCKTANLGHSLIITGGEIGVESSSQVFNCRLNHNQSNIEIDRLQPMNYSRVNHNLIYIHSRKWLFACSGQASTTAEMLEISDNWETMQKNKWSLIPELSLIRANATFICVNNTYLYLIGGYSNNEEKYIKGYERLNLNNIGGGWYLNNWISEMAISTMGTLFWPDNKLLLLGGFSGGKKYLTRGLKCKFNPETLDIVIIDLDSDYLDKGSIFFDNQMFTKVGSKWVGFDYRSSLLEYSIQEGQFTRRKDE